MKRLGAFDSTHTHLFPHKKPKKPESPRGSRALETQSVSELPAPKAEFLKGRPGDHCIRINGKLIKCRFLGPCPRPRESECLRLGPGLYILRSSLSHSQAHASLKTIAPRVAGQIPFWPPAAQIRGWAQRGCLIPVLQLWVHIPHLGLINIVLERRCSENWA